MKRLLTLLLALSVAHISSAQFQTVTSCGGDSVFLHLTGYQAGAIQWMVSTDQVNYTNINGATNDTMLVISDTNAYYLAEVIDGTCDPFYSDTTEHLVQATDTNPSIITPGFSSGAYSHGYEFNMVQTKTVTAISYMYGGTLNTTGFLKIWTALGVELSSTPITTTSVNWETIPITPITLDAGSDYVIGYTLNNASEGGSWELGNTWTLDSSVLTYTTGKYSYTTCCVFPADSWANNIAALRMIYCD